MRILTLSGDEVVGSMVALKERRGTTCWASHLHTEHSCTWCVSDFPFSYCLLCILPQWPLCHSKYFFPPSFHKADWPVVDSKHNSALSSKYNTGWLNNAWIYNIKIYVLFTFNQANTDGVGVGSFVLCVTALETQGKRFIRWIWGEYDTKQQQQWCVK